MMITKADNKDLQAILDLQYLCYQSEAKLFCNCDIPPLKQTLDDICLEYQQGVILKFSDDNNVIIGSVRAYSKDNTVYIGKLIVHPDHQKKGIGTKLLLAIESEYPSKIYELFTSSKSVDNIKLYEKIGYKIFNEKSITDELRFVYLNKG